MPFRRGAQADPVEEEGDGASIRLLLRRLGSETGDLVRAEIELAKLEVRDVVRQAALDGAKIGAAIALAFVGGLALLAWAILALGDLLGDRHATAALIIGVVLLVVGVLLARAGKKGMERGMRPASTMTSLKEDGRMAAEQLRQMKQELGRVRAENAARLPRHSHPAGEP